MSGEKTELPSPKKLRDARKKGQFPRSALASGVAPIFGAALAAALVTPAAWSGFSAWTTRLVLEGEGQRLAGALYEACRRLAWATALPVGAAMVMGVGVAAAQAGWSVQVGLVKPDWQRVDPFRGLRKIFRSSSLLEVGKAVFVTVVLVAAAGLWLSGHASFLLSTVRGQGEASTAEILVRLFGLMGRLLALLVLLAGADYLLARRAHLRSQMMSTEELRREHKEAEGSPEQKAHRQSLQRQLALGGAARGVRKATAIVVNPTHVAVALRYDPAECEAPYIVAKGCEADALEIRREALRLKIPVVRDVPLARSLVTYDVGEQVPEELYRAAAAVLHTALGERQAMKHFQGGAA